MRKIFENFQLYSIQYTTIQYTVHCLSIVIDIVQDLETKSNSGDHGLVPRVHNRG